ncbi:MAG: N-acetylmuramoyl-L-alanine amidase [Alphaproteobacteria bacterium]|nr:N-acetylmuramoyl-L-alanine amidase [Alphaproteobacteria bacterium]MCW5742291.1 N-acetylmuramoyl-L-alanine amidase [Alphaproteobacteria bacterium]
MIEAPSNNHGPREAPVAHLVLHHTAQPLDVSLDLLRFGRVSAHYVVDVNGDIYRLVAEERVAWHAGLSWWGDARALNETSIGIEIVNMDGNVHDYPAGQRDAVIGLCRGILERHPGIAARNVVGHSDIAPGRKDDPGGRFFWRALSEAGIGLWPTPSPAAGMVDEAGLLAVLRRIGYPPPHRYGTRDGRFAYVDGDDDAGFSEIVDVSPADILVAFQRRFRPARIDGRADAECLALARALDAAQARA